LRGKCPALANGTDPSVSAIGALLTLASRPAPIVKVILVV
jgi:hypothetical protein